MDTVLEFFNEMEPMWRTFWYVAIPASIIFILQTALTFLGVDANDGVDADFDSDLEGTDAPFQLFSLRNLINFMIGFGWSGVSLFPHISNRILLVAVATAIGLSFVFLFFYIIKTLLKLGENNSFRIEESIGKLAQVYLKIPANKSGRGKVQLSIRGSYREMDAMTEGEELATGAQVKITRVESGSILFVESL